MRKIQIQLPDALYRQVKSFSQDREWSMAETFRRAAEDLFERYSSSPVPPGEWEPPIPRDLGWKGLSPTQLHQAALAETEPCRP